MVRGGSFNNNRNNVRCAFRNRNDPDNTWNNNGFRVVSYIYRGLPEMPPGDRTIGPALGGRGVERWRDPSLAESCALRAGRANI